MIEAMGTAAVAAELEDARTRLRVIAARVEHAVANGPHRTPGDWHGLAAHAYGLALAELDRQLDATQGLLRSATDLLGAALVEVGGHA
jgi:hypothetical protein